jgi:hypothetical protein
VLYGTASVLSGAHDLLTAQTWSGAGLAALLRTQVSLNGTIDVDRIRLSGPKVLLPPQVALNLALIVHELATNALQHGAFSADAGTVSVNWSISMSPAGQEKFLQIVWSETGGPPVKEPEERGFGTVILERGLKLGLGGTYELQWERGGLVAELCMPLPASGYRKELFQTQRRWTLGGVRWAGHVMDRACAVTRLRSGARCLQFRGGAGGCPAKRPVGGRSRRKSHGPGFRNSAQECANAATG